MPAHTPSIQNGESGGSGKLSKRIGPRPWLHDEMEIGGKVVPFVWRLLMGNDKQDITSASCNRFDDLNIEKEFRYFADIEDEQCWQILYFAAMDPESGNEEIGYTEHLASDVEDVRGSLTVTERDHLVSRYLDWEEVVNPPAGNSEIFYGAIDEIVKKNAPLVETLSSLINFGSLTLASYLLHTNGPSSSSATSKSPTTSTSEADTEISNNEQSTEPSDSKTEATSPE